MAKTKHHTAAHDDETWKGFFRRWHEGEDSRALYAEAKVSPDTFHVHARRLGMRLKDLPEGHPAKRRSLPYSERPDWWREPNGKLCEGQWRELFALRAQGRAGYGAGAAVRGGDAVDLQSGAAQGVAAG